jgi:hypothetical protein
MIIEGVEYYRFRIYFRLANGKRRLWYRWSPGDPWAYDSIARELSDRFSPSEIRGPVRIEHAP